MADEENPALNPEQPTSAAPEPSGPAEESPAPAPEPSGPGADGSPTPDVEPAPESKRGGKRPGAGRPKGSKDKAPRKKKATAKKAAAKKKTAKKTVRRKKTDPDPPSPFAGIPSAEELASMAERGETPKMGLAAAGDLHTMAGALVDTSDHLLAQGAELAFGPPGRRVRATSEEKAQLQSATALYLATAEVEITPGWMLLGLAAIIYGPKSIAAASESRHHKAAAQAEQRAQPESNGPAEPFKMGAA